MPTGRYDQGTKLRENTLFIEKKDALSESLSRKVELRKRKVYFYHEINKQVGNSYLLLSTIVFFSEEETRESYNVKRKKKSDFYYLTIVKKTWKLCTYCLLKSGLQLLLFSSRFCQNLEFLKSILEVEDFEIFDNTFAFQSFSAQTSTF